MKLSTVILTHNSEKTLAMSIESVYMADEIIVLDDASEDGTKTLAKKLKATVIERKVDGDFAKQRNYGINQTKGDWILFLDSDEVLSPELKKEIGGVVASAPHSPIDAYYLKRRDIFWGRELRFGETHSVRTKGIIRLVKKNSGVWKGLVHERFTTSHKTSTLAGFIEHHPHADIMGFLRKINHYSTLRAEELREQGKKFSLMEIVFLPPLKFVYTYVIKLGFLDGAAGFTYAFMMSFHSFLVRAKLMNL